MIATVLCYPFGVLQTASDSDSLVLPCGVLQTASDSDSLVLPLWCVADCQ